MTCPLLIRADGSETRGTGHVMRCLALAQAWQDAARGPVHWLAHALTPALRSRLQSEGILILPALAAAPGSADDASALAATARRLEVPWTIIDSYDFRGNYQDHLRRAGVRHLAFDDNGHAGHYSADLVLNGNFHAREDFYRKRHPATRLLLGCRHTPLRREILTARSALPGADAMSLPRLLVTFGGSDPHNTTLRALQAVARLGPPGVACTAVVGGSNPHLASLRDYLAAHPGAAILEVDVADMGRLMASSDVALMAGGSSVLEALYFGLPMVIATIADNQLLLAEKLREAGLAVLAGHGAEASADAMASALDGLLRNPAQRAAMAEAARTCVDGKGIARILEMMDI